MISKVLYECFKKNFQSVKRSTIEIVIRKTFSKSAGVLDDPNLLIGVHQVKMLIDQWPQVKF